MRINLLSLLLLLLLSISTKLLAQADTSLQHAERNDQFNYFNSFLVGGLLGEEGRGTSFTFSTIHGVRFKSLSGGLGIGYDSYIDWRMLPLFVNVSVDFASIRSNKIFLQGNIGYADAHPLKEINNNRPSFNAKGGAMLNAMIGYRIRAQQYRLYFAAGYKLQRNKYTIENNAWIWGYPTNSVSVEEDMSRLVLQLGFGFY